MSYYTVDQIIGLIKNSSKQNFMLQAIINLINQWAERIKPCKHEWELLEKVIIRESGTIEDLWKNWTYRCKVCGEVNKVSSKQ